MSDPTTLSQTFTDKLTLGSEEPNVGSFERDGASAMGGEASSNLTSEIRQSIRRQYRESNTRRIESQIAETALSTKIQQFTKKYPSDYDTLRSLKPDQENCYIFGLEWDDRGGEYASETTYIYNGTLIRDVLEDASQSPGIRVSAKLFIVHSGRDSQTTRNDVLRRLDRQAEIWESMDHENIIPFIGLFVSWCSPSEYYFVSEYAEQGDVAHFLRQDDNRSKWASDLVRDLVAAMTYLHCGKRATRYSSGSTATGGGKFHGDLKSDNILVKMRNGRPFAQLCDFDFAGEMHSGGTLPTKGSHAWSVAPELAFGNSSDNRAERRSMRVKADIYSLGMTVYQMMTGITPFTNFKDSTLTLRGLWYNISQGISKFENYAPKKRAAISKGLYKLLSRSWSYNPSYRPTMEEFARTFHEL